ncbi:keratin-associated protein 5-4 isoform X3 [Cephus cinctus]|uniref:Keratin-associated protein 5-4 isoform X3 n=1 Tax=Cephus cinctus TaxID=211228 RepID=A0AAJ7R962_CEPCN|nr:keratin-associated protein 5-4 isoform X3 [Cephus cinctus]
MENDNVLINGTASLPDNEQINPGSSSYTDNVVELNQSENINENDDRLRGGCGGGSCGSGSSRVPLTGSGGCCSSGTDGGCGCSTRIGKSFSDSFCDTEGTCASAGSSRRMTGYETCPPRDPEPCYHGGSSSCTAAGCSPPCGGRQGCCPPLGCRPLCIKPPRCNPPCTGELQGCGGGGCCAGGCRGGCGKNGRLCMPLRSCSVPPCQPTAGRSYGSPCLPPRACPPQPPCCRSPRIMGTPSSMSGSSGGSSLCCRSKSPGRTSRGGGCCSPQDDNCCCQPRLPSGCECLGGGLDCQRCGRKVYQAEMQIASGIPYHNICFSCFCCRKPLESLTYQENCGEIYCKQCYVRNFGPQGYGYGAGAGVLQTPM